MAGGAADVFNGERAVVALFVSRVLLSAPLSLLYESLALFLLSACGLLVEISVESSSAPPRFKTRPGASSGTLLGAVTLPAVILSRLIQLSRVLLENNATSDEISGLDMQFWTVSASCFSVLIFFCLTFQHSPKNTTFFQLKNFRTSNCGLMHMVLLSMALCYLSFTAKADSGYLPLLKFVWLICHSLASVMLIQHILQAFPSCASLGEVLLVSSGLMLYFGDALAHSLSKALAFLAPSALTFLKYGTRSEIAIVIQGVMVGLFLFPAFYKIVLWAWLHLTNLRKPEALATNGGPNNVVEMSVLFYASLLFMLTALIPAWMYLVWDFQKHPVAWSYAMLTWAPHTVSPAVICGEVNQETEYATTWKGISTSFSGNRLLDRKEFRYLHNDMILSTLGLSPHGFALGLYPKGLIPMEISFSYTHDLSHVFSMWDYVCNLATPTIPLPLKQRTTGFPRPILDPPGLPAPRSTRPTRTSLPSHN